MVPDTIFPTQQAAVRTVDYLPYGERRISSGTDTSEREYIGEYFDESTSLSYLNARYYEGTRGQFLSEDPAFLAIGNPQKIKQMTGQDIRQYLADPQQLNSYSYAQDNPIRYKDPKGENALAYLFILGGFFLAVENAGPDLYRAVELKAAQIRGDASATRDAIRSQLEQGARKLFEFPFSVALPYPAGAIFDIGGYLQRLKDLLTPKPASGKSGQVGVSSSSSNNGGRLSTSGSGSALTSNQSSALQGVVNSFKPSNKSQEKAILDVVSSFNSYSSQPQK